MRVKGQSRTVLMALGMIATGLFFLPAAPVFLLTRGHASTALKSTEITAQIHGTPSISSAELLRSREEFFGAQRDDGLSAATCFHW